MKRRKTEYQERNDALKENGELVDEEKRENGISRKKTEN